MNQFGSWIRSPVLPTPAPLAGSLGRSLAVALGLFGLFLPWAPAGVSIMLAVLFFLGVLAAPAVWRCAPWRDPVIAVGLLLLGYIALHTLWISGFTPVAGGAINQYHELIMAAVLLALFRLAPRTDLFFKAMVVGAIGYALTHWAALFIPALSAYLSSRRISAGLCMTVIAFVLVEIARHSPRPWPIRAAAIFLCLTVLFAIDGRTGHLVLLILAGVVGWVHVAKPWRWIALVALPVVLLMVSFGSSAVRLRVAETIAGSTQAQNGNLSSTGIRIELMRTGLALSEKYYLTGAGFARYAEVNRESVMERFGPEPIRRALPWANVGNPHNEFVMQLVGGGLISFCLFIAWLTLPAMRTQNGHANVTLIGLVLAFTVGCLFNSMLKDFVEGHFYVALVAWLLAQPSLPAVAKTST